jgi:hypothetical protein
VETEVVGIAGLTTYDQYGTPEHGRQANRRDFQAHPINAVVVCKWHNRDYDPGGKTVFLINVSVDKPFAPLMITMTAVSSRIAISKKASNNGV